MSGSNSSAPVSPSVPADALDQPLTLTVHAVDVPDLDLHRRTRAGRWQMLLVLLVCAAPVLMSYLTYYVIRPGQRSNYGELIEPNRALPSADQLPLRDLSQAAVDPARLRGQWLLVVVADGACDDACEALLYMQRQLREGLGREKDRVDRVWLVTGDAPVRAELLPALQQALVLRVPQAALARWLAPAPGQSLSSHLYLVDPLGRWMMRFPPNAEPGKVRRDLERLLRASASWDRPGRE